MKSPPIRPLRVENAIRWLKEVDRYRWFLVGPGEIVIMIDPWDITKPLTRAIRTVRLYPGTETWRYNDSFYRGTFPQFVVFMRQVRENRPTDATPYYGAGRL